MKPRRARGGNWAGQARTGQKLLRCGQVRLGTTNFGEKIDCEFNSKMAFRYFVWF